MTTVEVTTLSAVPIRLDLRPRSVDPQRWQLVARLEPAENVHTIEEVIVQEEMVQRCYTPGPAGILPANRSGNGIFWFNRFYLMVTRGVRREHTRLPPEADRFITMLDIEFYGFYQRALCQEPGDNPVGVAWEPLFDRRDARTVHPMLFALAGMNAHIIGDLPQAIVNALCRLGRREFPEDRSDEHRAFTNLNAILYRVAGECLRKDFVAGVPGLVHKFFPVSEGRVGDAYIKTVRSLAWQHARLLWMARRSEDGERLMRQSIAESASSCNQWMLDNVPLTPHLRPNAVLRWFGDLVRRWGRGLGIAGGRLFRPIRGARPT